MFKVYKLEIKGVAPFLSPKNFTFSPFFTLIRGGNGAGKTTMLEALALLGHCCVMEHEDQGTSYKLDDDRHCFVKYTLMLGKCYFDDNEGEIGKLAQNWNEILGERSYKEVIIQIFRRKNKPCKELKEYLKEEDKLKRDWRISGEEKEVNFIKKLIAFSRPVQVLSESQQQEIQVQKILTAMAAEVLTLGVNSQQRLEMNIEAAVKKVTKAVESAKPQYSRPIRSDYLSGEVLLPPLICYFNTDMYHYGLGLDIRESPKHLKEELSLLVKDRLHLINESRGEIENFNLIREFWGAIYKGAGKEELDSIRFVGDKAKVKIIGQGGQRGFLSSGENQSLSLGFIFGALKPKHSILLLDEPDLHLSLPAGLRMYNEIFRRSITDKIQVISVSHLPFVFSRSLHDDAVTSNPEAYRTFFADCNTRFENSSDTIRDYFKSKEKRPRCVTLYYLRKIMRDGGTQPDIEIKMQNNAALEAGKYQNHEIDAILSQSKEEPPTLAEIAKSFTRIN